MKDKRQETREKPLLKSSNSACHCEERSDVAIQNGFKMTEVGMIPWDWEVVNLGDIAEMSSGTTPSRFNEKNFKGNVCWLSSGELKSHYIFDTKEKISENAASSMRLYPKGTVVIAMYGLEADGVRGTSSILATDCTISQACMAFTNLKKINNEFFYYWYAVNGGEIGTKYAQGTKQQNLSPDTMRLVKIPLPPTIEEQQRIANALSDVDTLISNLEKLIAKKKNIKQGAMQQLLTGRKRLPGFGPGKTKDERRETKEKQLLKNSSSACHCEEQSDATIQNNFKMTELGPIPSDWEVKKIDDIMLLSGDSVLSSKFKRENYVGTENMLPEKAGVVKNISVNPTNRAKGFLKHDILISNIRPYLKKIWLADKDGCCSNDVLVIRVKDCAEISAEFCYSILSDDKFFSFVMENAVGTKMPRGDKKMIKEYLFVVPSSKAEQTAIANVLSDMDSEIQTLETKLAKYRKLKTGMMQQLLTGKIRLMD